MLLVAAELRIEVRPLHIEAHDIFAVRLLHGELDLLDRLDILRGVHAEIECGQDSGRAVPQEKPCGTQGILWKEYAVCAVGMDVDHAWAEICALEIDDLAAVGDGRCAHLPKAGNYAVFDKQHRLRHKVVVQNKFCVNEG